MFNINNNKPLPLNDETFAFAVEYNAKELKRQLEAKQLIPSNFYWLSNNGIILPPGWHGMNVARWIDDVVAATVVQALPYSTNNGTDAVRYVNGVLVPIECKLGFTSKKGLLVSDSVYASILKGNPYGGRNNRTSFRSSLGAYYEIVNNLKKKNMETHLVVFDHVEYDLICAYKMDGNAITAQLTSNQTTGKAKTSKKRSIKLSAFVNNGKVSDTGLFKQKGLYVWEDEVRHLAYTGNRCGNFYVVE